MNSLLFNAMGLSLVHFLWEGAALAAALLLFHRASARSRYAAACTALFAMPVAFAATFYRFWHVAGLWVGPRVAPFLGGPLDTTSGGGSGTPAGASVWAWLVPVWMAGVAVFYLRSVGGWWAARRLRH